MRPQILQLYLGGDGRWLFEPTTLFRIMGKEICFYKIDPIIIAKKYRLLDIYDIFYWELTANATILLSYWAERKKMKIW